jgi:hypothetical protein
VNGTCSLVEIVALGPHLHLVWTPRLINSGGWEVLFAQKSEPALDVSQVVQRVMQRML